MSSSTLVTVCRQPGGSLATYRLSDFLGDLFWSNESGGYQEHFPFGQQLLCGYVWCDGALSGAVDHSGEFGMKNHGPCPHKIKVCVLKSENKAIFDSLIENLPPKPVRAKPKTGNTCKVDILSTLEQNGSMRETELTRKLVVYGHGENNIKAILKKLAKEKILICEKDPNDKRFNVYMIK